VMRPISDAGLERTVRVVASIGLFLSATHLLMRSTFRMRLRDDIPAILPGVSGVESAILVLGLILAIVPLLAGRRFVPAFLMSAFIATGLGAYWWTRVPWDELITESDFATTSPPGLLDFLLVASPLLVFAAAWALIAPLRQAADWTARGVDAAEAERTGRSSTTAGALLVVAALAAPAGVWLAHRFLWGGSLPQLLPGGVAFIGFALLALGVGGWLVSDESVREQHGLGERPRRGGAKQPKG